jgi:hypothetical protein
MLYDGDYSYELGFDVGFYRNGPEVTFRYFPDNELYEIDPRIGIIHEAGFTNTNGPDPVLWGLTSDEEMMVLGVQYIEGSELTGIEEVAPIEGLRLYPNPSSDRFSLSFNLLEDATIAITVLDVLGKQVAAVYSGNNQSGMFSHNFNASEARLSSGIYTMNITVDGATVSQKLVVTE